MIAKSGALCAALTLVCVSTNAFAHHPGATGNSNTSGAISTISATPLGKGEAVASIVAEHIDVDALSDEAMEHAAEHAHEAGDAHADIHSLSSISSLAFGFAYGLTDNLTLSVRAPYVRRRDIRDAHTHGGVAEVHDRGDSEGFGDISLLAQWRFYNGSEGGLQLAALFGVKAPTGSDDETNAGGSPFEAEFQPGSGAWDSMVGLAATRQFDTWSLDASGLYTIVGENDGADLGDRFSYGLAASFPVLRRGAHHHPGHDGEAYAFALDGVFELNGEWHDRQSLDGHASANSGGHVLYAAPGLRVNVHNVSAFASVGVPLINDLNGVQAEPSARVLAGAALRF